MPPTNPTASKAAPGLGMPPVPPETEVVDDGHGGKMFQMTAKWDVAADELRARIADLDRQADWVSKRGRLRHLWRLSAHGGHRATHMVVAAAHEEPRGQTRKD